MAKKVILIVLVLAILTECKNTEYQELAGRWYYTYDPEYTLDTLGIDDDFESGLEQFTIKTDTGIIVTEYKDDTLFGIKEYSKVTVADFHFDDRTHGVASFYELDTLVDNGNENPRYTAQNMNFWIYERGANSMIIFDFHYNQFGRAIDTVEFKLLANKLILRTDTLHRLKTQVEP